MLQAMIAKSVDVFLTDWDEYLPQLLFAYRHTSLRTSRRFTSCMGEMPEYSDCIDILCKAFTLPGRY